MPRAICTGVSRKNKTKGMRTLAGKKKKRFLGFSFHFFLVINVEESFAISRKQFREKVKIICNELPFFHCITFS